MSIHRPLGVRCVGVNKGPEGLCSDPSFFFYVLQHRIFNYWFCNYLKAPLERLRRSTLRAALRAAFGRRAAALRAAAPSASGGARGEPKTWKPNPQSENPGPLSVNLGPWAMPPPGKRSRGRRTRKLTMFWGGHGGDHARDQTEAFLKINLLIKRPFFRILEAWAQNLEPKAQNFEA